VSPGSLEAIADEVEQALQESPNARSRPAPSAKKVMERLKALDEVAYVPLRQCYRTFRTSTNFMRELKEILEQRK